MDSFVFNPSPTSSELGPIMSAASSFTDESGVPTRRRATVDVTSSRPSRRNSCAKRRASLPVTRRIRFATTSEVCVFEAPSTSKKWYTNHDHRRFKRQRAIDAMSFRQQQQQQARAMGPQDLREQACPVGLEKMLSEEVMCKAEKSRKYAVRAVLREQNRQRSFGLQDPVRIALISVEFTAESLSEAVKRGKFQEIATHV